MGYVRGRVSEIVEEPDKRLRVRFEDTVTGRKNEELFDLVVLSAGLEASEGTAEIARVAGLQTTGGGFLKEYHPKLRPVDTPACRVVRVRHGARSEEHSGFDRAGQGGRGEGAGHAFRAATC